MRNGLIRPPEKGGDKVIEKTVYGICTALRDAFEYEVHLEQAEPNPITPCFLIVPLRNERVQETGNRYRQEQEFEIRYFPQKEKAVMDSVIVMERLYDVLEYIVIDGNIAWGKGMRGEIQEGTLHFYVNYNLFVRKQQEQVRMERADISTMERVI